jgi:hypothetical protein
LPQQFTANLNGPGGKPRALRRQRRDGGGQHRKRPYHEAGQIDVGDNFERGRNRGSPDGQHDISQRRCEFRHPQQIVALESLDRPFPDQRRYEHEIGKRRNVQNIGEPVDMGGVDLHQHGEIWRTEPDRAAQDGGQQDRCHRQKRKLAADQVPVAVLPGAGHDLGRNLGQAEVQHRHHPGRQQQPRDHDEAEFGHAPGADDHRDDDQTKDCGSAKRDGGNDGVLDQALDHRDRITMRSARRPPRYSDR